MHAVACDDVYDTYSPGLHSFTILLYVCLFVRFHSENPISLLEFIPWRRFSPSASSVTNHQHHRQSLKHTLAHITHLIILFHPLLIIILLYMPSNRSFYLSNFSPSFLVLDSFFLLCLFSLFFVSVRVYVYVPSSS